MRSAKPPSSVIGLLAPGHLHLDAGDDVGRVHRVRLQREDVGVLHVGDHRHRPGVERAAGGSLPAVAGARGAVVAHTALHGRGAGAGPHPRGGVEDLGGDRSDAGRLAHLARDALHAVLLLDQASHAVVRLLLALRAHVVERVDAEQHDGQHRQHREQLDQARRRARSAGAGTDVPCLGGLRAHPWRALQGRFVLVRPGSSPRTAANGHMYGHLDTCAAPAAASRRARARSSPLANIHRRAR